MPLIRITRNDRDLSNGKSSSSEKQEIVVITYKTCSRVELQEMLLITVIREFL